MPLYDVCVQVDTIEAGSAISLADCDNNSDLQKFAILEEGLIKTR